MAEISLSSTTDELSSCANGQPRQDDVQLRSADIASRQAAACIFAAAACVPVLMSVAAACAMLINTDPHVLICVWIVIAVVGTASVISASVAVQVMFRQTSLRS